MVRRLLVGFLLIASLVGCSKPSISNDPAFARKVVDAVYAGTLSPLKDSLSPQCQLNDAWAKQTGDSLVPEFGAIKDVKLNTIGQGTATTKERIWTVTTDRSTFLMQLIYDQDDKLLSIQFNY